MCKRSRLNMTGNKEDSRYNIQDSGQGRKGFCSESEVGIQFLSIGHFTHDVAENGLILGGSASYSSITANRLGLRAGVVSSVGSDFLYYEKFHGISLALVRSNNGLTTTFQNIYEDGVRRQIIKSVSASIGSEHVPEEWLCVDIVYLCPVANEIDPAIVHKFPDSIIGASPQGWMRQWDDNGRVSPRKWKDAKDILPYIDVIIMSEEDISPFPEVVREYVDLVDALVLTRGDKGSTLFHKGRVTDFPAFKTNVVDPTGAGDVFATALLIRFHQTHDLYSASVFANCTASFVVEQQGIKGIPDLDHVYSRMKSSL